MSDKTVMEIVHDALGEQILVVNARLFQHRDNNDLAKYLRDKDQMNDLERAREVLR